jgi:hypothetical protein
MLCLPTSGEENVTIKSKLFQFLHLSMQILNAAIIPERILKYLSGMRVDHSIKTYPLRFLFPFPCAFVSLWQ